MTVDGPLISSKYVQVDGLNIHYLAAGKGEPVVLLHGWPTSSYLWRRIIRPLAKTRQVIAPDLPGFGQSDRPADGPYTISYYSRVLDRFLQKLDIRQTAMVVHDLGGPVGLLWTIKNPERVTRLAVLDTFVYPKFPFWMKLFLLMAWIPWLKDWLVSPGGIALIMKLGVANKKMMTRDVIASYQSPFITSEAQAVLLETLKAIRPDEFNEIAQELPILDIPIHIIYGEKDFMLAPVMRRLKQDIPNAPLTAVPNCGHFLQEDRPEELSKLLVEFLSK